MNLNTFKCQLHIIHDSHRWHDWKLSPQPSSVSVMFFSLCHTTATKKHLLPWFRVKVDMMYASSHLQPSVCASVCVCVCVCACIPILMGTSICLHSHVVGTSDSMGTKIEVPIRETVLNECRSHSKGAYVIFSFGP